MKVGKGGPLSQTDLEFLGYREIHEHKPWEFNLSERCRVFDGTASAGISKAEHWFIYLLADATNKDIEGAVTCAGSGVFPRGQLFVVVPKSLSVRRALAQCAGSAELVVFEDLMWGRIRELFTGYLKTRLSGMQEQKAGIQYVARKPSRMRLTAEACRSRRRAFSMWSLHSPAQRGKQILPSGTLSTSSQRHQPTTLASPS